MRRQHCLKAGLSLGTISYEYSTTYAEGEVIWQQYDANAQLDKGTSVRDPSQQGRRNLTEQHHDRNRR